MANKSFSVTKYILKSHEKPRKHIPIGNVYFVLKFELKEFVSLNYHKLLSLSLSLSLLFS